MIHRHDRIASPQSEQRPGPDSGSGHDSRSYTTCGGTTDKIIADMVAGVIDPYEFPGFLSVAVTVECVPDGKLILCRRTKFVKDEPRQWAAVGENMRRDEDHRGEHGLHPYNTVLRGLAEELGHSKEIERAQITVLAVGLSILNFSMNFFVHARVQQKSPQLMEFAQARAQDREWDIIEATGSDLSNCLDIVVYPYHSSTRRGKAMNQITSWSRLGVLYFALARYGPDLVLAGLANKNPLL